MAGFRDLAFSIAKIRPIRRNGFFTKEHDRRAENPDATEMFATDWLRFASRKISSGDGFSIARNSFTFTFA